MLPIAPELRTTWLVHKDAREHEDYDVENLTAVWRATNSQDRALVEMSQQGVRNPAYSGPYSPMPRAWWKFCNWYVGRLTAYCLE